LWPGWALRLSPPALAHSSSRTVLAAAVLLVSSDLDIGDGADLLGGAVTRLNAVYLLWRFKESPCWPAIRDALAVLSDYLNDHGAPIDYHRRRRLDYRGLLPQDEWNRICRGLGRQTHPAAHTRTYLQHRIAGTTQPHNDPAPDPALGEFPRRLTPELSRTLHSCAVNFLALRGIQDEPVVWEPPMGIVHGLVLPGVGITDVDIGELHRLIRQTVAPSSPPASSWGSGPTSFALPSNTTPPRRCPHRHGRHGSAPTDQAGCITMPPRRCRGNASPPYTARSNAASPTSPP